MSKARNQIENQMSLFAEPAAGGFEKAKYPVTYGKKGSYVSVAERAHFLINALNAMSQRNIREGLSVAAYTSPASKPIWERYEENTTKVLRGADRNRAEFEEVLRINFWQATGFAALRGAGLMREAQINPRAQKMWRDFNHKYGHTDRVKARNEYKNQLEATLTLTQGQGTDVAA